MSEGSLHHDEGGRVAIFFVLSAIPFIFLIALIYNTSQQSIRKIQMQGAADAAAIAGGTQAARDLNDIANNNNTMSEILTVMITLRSVLQTLEILRDELFAAGVVAAASVVGAEAAPPLFAASRAVDAVARVVGQIDSAISDTPNGVGWLVMRAMDTLNTGIKFDFPFWAEKHTSDFAQRNGADRGLHGILIAGESPGLNLLPTLPVARGNEVELVERAEETYLKYIQPLPGPLAAALAVALPANPITLFFGMVEYNKANLKGSQITAAISGFLSIFMTGPLDWPNDPPKPMLLTDNPPSPLDPAATMDTRESDADLSKVRKYLQYLAIATGKMPRGSRIGGERFLNVAPYESLTYAESDVYNPTDWSMFEQNWQVKLAPAVVLNEKLDQITGIIGIRVPQALNGLAFVNNH